MISVLGYFRASILIFLRKFRLAISPHVRPGFVRLFGTDDRKTDSIGYVDWILLSIKKMVQMLGISGCFGLLLKKSINQCI